MSEFDKAAINWQKVDGLLPCIVQDAKTAQVLMLGYMNPQALKVTQQTGKVTFFSRTKDRLWTKGETSGNFLQVVSMVLDCDQDALLVLAHPQGNTCHTGAVSCFFGQQVPSLVFLMQLESLINARKTHDADASYTASLFAQGTKRIAQKVAEEGVETALAAVVRDRDETICEAADLLYHLTVLLQDANLSLVDVVNKLKARHTLRNGH